MEIKIMKNMVDFGYHGSTYGQDIEVTGTYVLEKDFDGPINNDGRSNWVEGIADIKNALYIEEEPYGDSIQYKRDLYKKYKLKGDKLTKKLMSEGYDCIITFSKRKGKDYTGEIILFPNCNFHFFKNESLSLLNIFNKIIN